MKPDCRERDRKLGWDIRDGEARLEKKKGDREKTGNMDI